MHIASSSASVAGTFGFRMKYALLLVMLAFAVSAQAQQSCATSWRLTWISLNDPDPVGSPFTGTDKTAVCQASAYPVWEKLKSGYGGPGYTWGPPQASVIPYQTLGRCRISAIRVNSVGQQQELYYVEEFENIGSTCEPSSETLIRLKNAGAQQCGASNNIGNPVNAATGNKYQEETDYAGSGDFPLQFIRRYNSHLWYGSSNPPSNTGEFFSRAGFNWRTNYDRFIRYFGTAQVPTAYVYRPDGRILAFRLINGSFVSEDDISDRLIPLIDGAGNLSGWTYKVCAQDEVEKYSYSGRLMSITARSGQTQTLTYRVAGGLQTVKDSFGRVLTLGYDSSNRLVSLTTPSGDVITYTHNSTGRQINSVTFPDGKVRTYVYGETGTPYSLTGIIDESRARYSTYTYSATDPKLATSTKLAGDVNHYSFNYGPGGSYTTVTDPLGVARAYDFATTHNVAKNTAIGQPCSGSCGGSGAAEATYDANGNVASREDFNGNLTCYAYDLTRNLETVRVEGFSPGSTCPANLASYASATGTRERRISTIWHSAFRIPMQIDEPGKRTTFDYDASGNLLTKTELDTGASESRTWTYTYNAFGQVLTADGSRTDVADVTTYTYYVCTTGYQCGQLKTMTNALGQVTTFNTYNAHGQPLTITDPNGLVTTLTYDLRQRLTSRAVGTEQSTFEYWPTGLLKKATLPDGSFIAYAYDAAHRLTGISDSEGNRIAYTLDAMGNRTKEEVFDPANALTQTRTRVFNTLSRLVQEIGAAGTPAVTTGFGYDDNGNQTSISAPLSRNTVQAYDELNRLTQVTDPATGLTQYGYNTLDQLIAVTDPRNKVTSYTYNALGDLLQQASPDTGTTVHTYDSGGNLQTQTDARSKTSTYSYDALNRISQLSYPDQTITYSYDQGTNGVGRLTGVADGSGSTAWTYDAHGRVNSRQQVMGGASKLVGYTYNSAGQLQSLTLPSGSAISYGYQHGKVTSLTLNGSTTILSDVLYQPFGPLQSWAWGNATLAVREYDADGKVTDIDSAGLKTYAYDDAFRITGITDVDNSALSQTYGYDLLDRLTTATGTSLNQSWTYDANGNRLTEGGAQSSTYTIATTNNRITSISGSLTRTYAYDAAGNTTGDGAATYSYDDAGRMVSATKAGVTASYKLNALGQRVKKTINSVGTYFVYDEAGHLLGEYDNAGNLIQETVWLGDTPVATLRPNGSGGADVFYIHTDHLNTPRRITRPGDNVIVWRWDSDPFGTTAPNQNPSGVGAFVYNLRFPGQYADSETGLSQNYFRDYDPAIGRYPQSDPIGLEGGINTYAYVGSNPVSRIDPSGLQVVLPLPAPPPPVTGTRNPGYPIGGGLGELLSSVANTVTELAYRCANQCPPCKTVSGKIVAIGTIGYRPLDVIPDDVKQHGVFGSHHNLFKANQIPYPNCDCFWQKLKDVAKPDQLQPTWIPIEPFAN